jgi:prepilin-type N-terminal cleavage/methylation domain-containing protein
MLKINRNLSKVLRLRWLSGFSLIELLVVISIIGVLTAVLMMNLVGARDRSKDTQKIQDLNSIKNALRMYYNDYQAYPTGSLGAGFTEYIPGLLNFSGYTYTVTNSGNGFSATVVLESAAGGKGGDSQLSCGVSTGNTDPDVYMVCGN